MKTFFVGWSPTCLTVIVCVTNATRGKAAKISDGEFTQERNAFHLHTSGRNWSTVWAHLEELDWRLRTFGPRLLSLAVVNHELALEVRQEFQVLLLLQWEGMHNQRKTYTDDDLSDSLRMPNWKVRVPVRLDWNIGKTFRGDGKSCSNNPLKGTGTQKGYRLQFEFNFPIRKFLRTTQQANMSVVLPGMSGRLLICLQTNPQTFSASYNRTIWSFRENFLWQSFYAKEVLRFQPLSPPPAWSLSSKVSVTWLLQP